MVERYFGSRLLRAVGYSCSDSLAYVCSAVAMEARFWPHAVKAVLSLARQKRGTRTAASRTMMAIAVSNSIRVKPASRSRGARGLAIPGSEPTQGFDGGKFLSLQPISLQVPAAWINFLPPYAGEDSAQRRRSLISDFRRGGLGSGIGPRAAVHTLLTCGAPSMW